VNWGRYKVNDHVAPCSCRLLLETAPARLLPALEARPLLQRPRRTQPGSQGKKIPCPIRPPVIFTDHGIEPNAESFAAFQIEMTSPGFQEELEKARDNPKSKEAGKLIQRLKRFITMSGVKIPSPECDAFNEADLNLPHLGLAWCMLVEYWSYTYSLAVLLAPSTICGTVRGVRALRGGRGIRRSAVW